LTRDNKGFENIHPSNVLSPDSPIIITLVWDILELHMAIIYSTLEINNDL
jgi:hypothetical protein